MKIDDEDFERLKVYMHDSFGINLSKKQSLIEGRLGGTIARRGFANFHDYIDHVLADPSNEEIALLVSKLTTNYTYFMREEQHYKFLTDIALPQLIPTIKDNDLRIWSAGCSSGEEPYTTAMVLSEYFGVGRRESWDATVLATDISDNVLRMAKKGYYQAGSLSRLPAGWDKRYFSKVDADTYQVSPQLKKGVQFARFNLMERQFPFKKKFHVIFCRNVMIYFDGKTKEELALRFFNTLMPGGYLFIGLSETMVNIDNTFEYVRPSIYRKGRA